MWPSKKLLISFTHSSRNRPILIQVIVVLHVYWCCRSFSSLSTPSKTTLLSTLKCGLTALQSSVRRLIKEKNGMVPPIPRSEFARGICMKRKQCVSCVCREMNENTRLHRTALKMYTLLLCHICKYDFHFFFVLAIVIN